MGESDGLCQHGGEAVPKPADAAEYRQYDCESDPSANEAAVICVTFDADNDMGEISNDRIRIYV